MAFTPDGRIFISEEGGKIRDIKNESLLSKPFITLNVNKDHEWGIHGITFHPGFNTNNYVYIYYTVQGLQVHGS
jgi:hypothetical protein